VEPAHRILVGPGGDGLSIPIALFPPYWGGGPYCPIGGRLLPIPGPLVVRWGGFCDSHHGSKIPLPPPFFGV